MDEVGKNSPKWGKIFSPVAKEHHHNWTQRKKILTMHSF